MKNSNNSGSNKRDDQNDNKKPTPSRSEQVQRKVQEQTNKTLNNPNKR